MTTISRHVSRTTLLQCFRRTLPNQTTSYSTRKPWYRSKKSILYSAGILVGGIGTLLLSLDKSVRASDVELHPPKNPWYHKGVFNSLDHGSIRRGYEVFKQVCAACHSVEFIAYRNLVNVTHTEKDAKAEAQEQTVQDGPDENGNMFERAGKLSDRIPKPYPNEEAARAANNSSYPPDLCYIILAREKREDYLFALLTGYCDPPAGVNLREGQYYNPYFPGGAIAMAPPLYNDIIQYSDGTPATTSQMAKDVTIFLKWAGEPEFDDRKVMLIRAIWIFSLLSAFGFYFLRHRWTTLITREIKLKPLKKE